MEALSGFSVLFQSVTFLGDPGAELSSIVLANGDGHVPVVESCAHTAKSKGEEVQSKGGIDLIGICRKPESTFGINKVPLIARNFFCMC